MWWPLARKRLAKGDGVNRPRRDPRAERASRSVNSRTLRPRFDLAVILSTSRRSRRDPRASFLATQIAGHARLRIDRASHSVGLVGGPRREEAAASEANVRIVDEPAFTVLAVLEAAKGRLSRLDRQILGAGRLLADAGEDGGAVVAVLPQAVDGLGEAGADRILILGENGLADADATAGRLLSLDRDVAPRHWLFAESGSGADLARRLAVRLKQPILTDVEHLTARQAVRASHGGLREEAGPPPRLMTVQEDRVAPYADRPCEARPLDAQPMSADATDSAIIKTEIVPGDPTTMSLAEADFVVSAGNGVTDFEAFGLLAEALKATPGASRVICDAGLMPREAQVGASGTVLSADCYFALGIAGAPQHLQGITGCEHVIAVNTDLHAAMIERAGLAIVQDAQKVMPALLRLLRERNR